MALTQKWFEVKIFTSNHFRTHTQRERERSHPDHATNPLTSLFFELNKIQLWLRLRIAPRSHPSTLSVNPEPKSRLRLRRDHTLGSHRSHWDRTSGSHRDDIDRTEITPISLFLDLVPPSSVDTELSLTLSSFFSQLDRIWWIFLVGFCFCVYLLRNGIIYLFGSWENVRNKKKNVFSILFSATQPNTRKYFPKHFLECNQTLENIFLSRK